MKSVISALFQWILFKLYEVGGRFLKPCITCNHCDRMEIVTMKKHWVHSIYSRDAHEFSVFNSRLVSWELKMEESDSIDIPAAFHSLFPSLSVLFHLRVRLIPISFTVSKQ